MNQKLLDFTIKYDSGGNSEFWNDFGQSMGEGIPMFLTVFLIVIGIFLVLCIFIGVGASQNSKTDDKQKCIGKVIEKISKEEDHKLNKLVFEVKGERKVFMLYDNNIFVCATVGETGVITYKGDYLYNFEVVN